MSLSLSVAGERCGYSAAISVDMIFEARSRVCAQPLKLVTTEERFGTNSGVYATVPTETAVIPLNKRLCRSVQQALPTGSWPSARPPPAAERSLQKTVPCEEPRHVTKLEAAVCVLL